MIGHASRYLYIFTPYLITDNEMYTALKLAAKRGVDVRIGLAVTKHTFGMKKSRCILIDAHTRFNQVLIVGLGQPVDHFEGHGGDFCRVGTDHIGMVPEEVHEDKCDRSDFKTVFTVVIAVWVEGERESYVTVYTGFRCDMP